MIQKSVALPLGVTLALFGTFFPAEAAPQQAVLATYVGGPKTDALTGAAVLPDGSIVVAGTFDAMLGGPKGKTPEGGRGAVLRYDPDGKPLGRADLPGQVADLDVDAAGNLYVAGDFGVRKLDASLEKTLFENETQRAAERVAAGPEGGAVVLAGKEVTLLDAAGKTRTTFEVKCSYATDVTCHPGEKLVVVCGFDNKRGLPPGQRNYPVQVAYVRAFDRAGNVAWNAYGWAGQEVADLHLMADTRAYRVAVGGDGKIYVAGESAGGNSMWTRASHDIEGKDQFVKGDKFQHAYNTGANHITAVARLDARSGRSEVATLLLSRRESGRGANYRPRAIAADAEGNVYVGGFSDAFAPKTPGSFGTEGGGAYFLVLDKGLKRTYATVLAGSGVAQAVATGGGRIVAVGQCRGDLATFKPHKPSGDEAGEGFLVILGSPID